MMIVGGGAHAATLGLKGTPVQGGIMFGRTDPGCVVEFDAMLVKVSDDGYFVIGFRPDQPAWSVLRTVCPDGSRRRQFLPIEHREYPEQHIDGLPPKMVTPDEETQARIKAEAERVRAARETESEIQSYRDPFIWPVQGIVTGLFGARRVLNGEPRSPHYAVDIAAETGTPVMATAAGTVVFADHLYLSGKTVIVDHGHGLTSSYLHLDSIAVAVGDEVKQGQTIASVGATGRVTGAHLDWRFNWYQVRLDPELVAGPMPAE
jgi:biotin carboxyl carrier protein